MSFKVQTKPFTVEVGRRYYALGDVVDGQMTMLEETVIDIGAYKDIEGIPKLKQEHINYLDKLRTFKPKKCEKVNVWIVSESKEGKAFRSLSDFSSCTTTAFGNYQEARLSMKQKSKLFGAGIKKLEVKMDHFVKLRQQKLDEGDTQKAKEIEKYLDGMLDACLYLGYETNIVKTINTKERK